LGWGLRSIKREGSSFGRAPVRGRRSEACPGLSFYLALTLIIILATSLRINSIDHILSNLGLSNLDFSK